MNKTKKINNKTRNKDKTRNKSKNKKRNKNNLVKSKQKGGFIKFNPATELRQIPNSHPRDCAINTLYNLGYLADSSIEQLRLLTLPETVLGGIHGGMSVDMMLEILQSKYKETLFQWWHIGDREDFNDLFSPTFHFISDNFDAAPIHITWGDYATPPNTFGSHSMIIYKRIIEGIITLHIADGQETPPVNMPLDDYLAGMVRNGYNPYIDIRVLVSGTPERHRGQITDRDVREIFFRTKAEREQTRHEVDDYHRAKQRAEEREAAERQAAERQAAERQAAERQAAEWHAAERERVLAADREWQAAEWLAAERERVLAADRERYAEFHRQQAYAEEQARAQEQGQGRPYYGPTHWSGSGGSNKNIKTSQLHVIDPEKSHPTFMETGINPLKQSVDSLPKNIKTSQLHVIDPEKSHPTFMETGINPLKQSVDSLLKNIKTHKQPEGI
jgi:hypothetical protein